MTAMVIYPEKEIRTCLHKNMIRDYKEILKKKKIKMISVINEAIHHSKMYARIRF